MGLTRVERTEVDGVPVFWGDVPGPLRAGLVFRTGRVDEPFVRAGWTHLSEHLALSSLSLEPHVNGSVSLVLTSFDTSGSPDDVTAFLRTVCGSARELPVERFDLERRILAAEASRRGGNPVDYLLLHRFGIDGYGAGYRAEFGLHAATPAAVAEFARTSFARGAAALWLTGPPPAGLGLMLPDGPARPLPEPRSFLPPGPHHLVEEDCDPTLSALVRGGGVDVSAFATVLRARLLDRLRVRDGISYGAGVYAGRLRDDLMHVCVSVDAAPGEHAAATRGLLAVLDELAAAGPTPKELAAGRPDHDDDSDVLWLVASATAAASGRPLPGPIEDEYATVSPERVAELAREVLSTALYMVPAPDPDVAARMPHVPVWAPALPGGTVHYRGEDEKRRRRIVVTDQGAGAHVGPDQYLTIEWHALSGVLAWDDGTRRLIANDGNALLIAPADLPEAGRVPEMVDHYAGPHRIAPQPPVDPAPAPETAPDADHWERELASRRGELRSLRREATTSVVQLVAVVAALLVAFSVVLYVLALVVPAVLPFAVPALVGFLYVSYREYRKEKP